eukprot:TRINITY_DN991_c0_g1_i2.p1 TRINITY_DN991_c0_g1~~TRINITY_DN991_c0_g1_i2.p1  ORF type:complete len:181 (+),score=37.24 TRINITY_DN991_c0_g1_i2:62-604(+)
MFKKFTSEENIAGQNQAKTSVARSIKNKILADYPKLEPFVDEIFPKKTPVFLVKCSDHVQLVSVNQQILFFQERDGFFYPALRLLHKYPEILPIYQVDRGAIKFVMSGANIMCPGLTSAGGKMDDVPTNTPVAVMAEGKKHALAIGLTKMSSEEIRTNNKGIGVDNIHYLNDGLWKAKLL